MVKLTFLAKDDISIPVAFFKSVFVAQLDKSNQLSLFFKILVLENIHSFILWVFLSTQLLKELSQTFHLTDSLLPFLVVTSSTLNSF